MEALKVTITGSLLITLFTILIAAAQHYLF